MSAYEIRRKLEARREFDFEHSGVVWRYRIPSEIEFLGLLGSIPDDQFRSATKQASVFVPACLVGWKGPKVSDIDADGPQEPLVFDRELVNDVLDRFAASILPAYVELMARYKARQSNSEAEVKN